MGKISLSRLFSFFQPARLPDPPLSHIRQGRQTVHVPKCSSTLGIAIEGGANTKQPLPRIISIQPNGAAFQAGGLRIGQLIREVDGISLEGQYLKEGSNGSAECVGHKWLLPDLTSYSFQLKAQSKNHLCGLAFCCELVVAR